MITKHFRINDFLKRIFVVSYLNIPPTKVGKKLSDARSDEDENEAVLRYAE